RAAPRPPLEDHFVMSAAALPQFEREFRRDAAARPGCDLDPDTLICAARDLLRLVPHRLGIAAGGREADRRPVAIVRPAMRVAGLTAAWVAHVEHVQTAVALPGHVVDMRLRHAAEQR